MKTHDGLYFDKLNLEADDILYELWGTERNKVKPVPEIYISNKLIINNLSNKAA